MKDRLEAHYVIRKATTGDIDILCAIEETGSRRWKKQLFLDEFDHDFSTTLIIEKYGTPCGFAIIWVVHDEIHLNNIAVLPEFRNQGIATKLLDRIIEDSPVTPVTILLEVRESNRAARQFYLHYGFIEQGVRKKYYGDEDALLMAWKEQ